MNKDNFTYDRVSNEKFDEISGLLPEDGRIVYMFGDSKGSEADIPACLLETEVTCPDEEVIRIFYADKGMIFQTRKKQERSGSVTPFDFRNGSFYSVEDDGKTVGLFISNGATEYYPNGDNDGFIHYKVHACLFNEGTVINPITLAGPNINGNKGVRYPRELKVRYASKEEEEHLLTAMMIRSYKWDRETLSVVKI